MQPGETASVVFTSGGIVVVNVHSVAFAQALNCAVDVSKRERRCVSFFFRLIRLLKFFNGD